MEQCQQILSCRCLHKFLMFKEVKSSGVLQKKKLRWQKKLWRSYKIVKMICFFHFCYPFNSLTAPLKSILKGSQRKAGNHWLRAGLQKYSLWPIKLSVCWLIYWYEVSEWVWQDTEMVLTSGQMLEKDTKTFRLF